MKKTLIFNILLTGVFFWGLWAIEKKGGNGISTPSVPLTVTSQSMEQFRQNLNHPLSLLLLQILLILIVSRIFGFLLRALGQQTVIGEILAGIFLGPSALKVLFPDFFQFIFPPESLGTLQFLSQIGLAFFMFIIGMELDIDFIRKKAKDALVVSNASIAFPFLLGVFLSLSLYDKFAPAGVGFLAFSLFMGISVSITAFPVLARILQERKMTKTPLGGLAIICAATNDLTAWCILASVIAISKAGGISSALFTIGLAILFVVIMLFFIKPFLAKALSEQVKKDDPGKVIIAVAFGTLLCSALMAELIGIHALFGSFLAGVIMPHNLNFKQKIGDKMEDVSVLLLLPIFFAFTGLRTQIGLLTGPGVWESFGLILLVAVSGKFLGSALSAKFMGQSWKNSLMLGALMNTRGLMELIVLNIGYDLGILSPQIFAMMVLMALATTFMTGPCLNLIEWISRKRNNPANLST